MTIELGIRPSGHLRCYTASTDTSATFATPVPAVIEKAFGKGIAEGLFALAAYKNAMELPPGFRFWREFSCIYMTARCHHPDSTRLQAKTLEFSALPELTNLLACSPPMMGAEYLSPKVFEHAWITLDNWLCDQVNLAGGNLAEFLKKKAPIWHQVGRVCFHLAENKKDFEYPFAFMATYVAQLSNRGNTQHQPLNKALQEYAGARQKKPLINLLSPV